MIEQERSRCERGRSHKGLTKGLFQAGVALLLILAPARIFAHPMGNFSINHYAGIRVEVDRVEVHYIIDMAEIPTFQEMQQSGISPQVNDPTVRAYLLEKAGALQNGLRLFLSSQPLELRLVSQDVIFPVGAANLPTMKLGIVYRASLPTSCLRNTCELLYQDSNFPGHAGWKEIVVASEPGVALVSSSAQSRDRSMELTNYPTDLLNSAPQDLEARIVFRAAPLVAIASVNPTSSRTAAPSQEGSLSRPAPTPAEPSPVLTANQQQTPRNAFTELIASEQGGVWVLLLAAAIAAGLGGLHALEPGHGKTVVAAYLVGSKGRVRDAVLLGLIVTASHTAGVYLLGAVTLYAQRYIMPDRLYPLLGVLSGLLIAGMGCYLFLQRYLGMEAAHQHGPGGHQHYVTGFPQAPLSAREKLAASATIDRKVSVRSLLVLGISGGIVPCPAALVVLLSAAALHRVAFGLFLIVVFSLGLAAALIAMGIVAVCARSLMTRVPTEGPLIQRWLPMTSAAMITVLGCVVAIRGLAAAGVLPIRI